MTHVHKDGTWYVEVDVLRRHSQTSLERLVSAPPPLEAGNPILDQIKALTVKERAAFRAWLRRRRP